MKIKVNIDSRERKTAERMITHFQSNQEKYPHIEPPELKYLKVGDTATDDGNIGIERKSKVDFIESNNSGLLKQQLFELRSNYKTPLLVVEDYDGIMDCTVKNPQLHPNVVLGVVSSAMSHNGVPIIFVGPFYIPFVFQLIEKAYDEKKQEYENIGYRPLRRSYTKEDIKKNILIGLPYVDEILSSRLLQTFDNSIKNITNASIEDLMKVPGIGEERARQIKEVLG